MDAVLECLFLFNCLFYLYPTITLNGESKRFTAFSFPSVLSSQQPCWEWDRLDWNYDWPNITQEAEVARS